MQRFQLEILPISHGISNQSILILPIDKDQDNMLKPSYYIYIRLYPLFKFHGIYFSILVILLIYQVKISHAKLLLLTYINRHKNTHLESKTIKSIYLISFHVRFGYGHIGVHGLLVFIFFFSYYRVLYFYPFI